MTEPEAMHVMKILVEFRNKQATYAKYQSVERALDALSQHPDIMAYREYTLNDMAKIGEL